MPNMSYCRFHNTVQAMEDCIEEIDEFDPSEATGYEKTAFRRFIELCNEVTESYDIDELLADKGY